MINITQRFQGDGIALVRKIRQTPDSYGTKPGTFYTIHYELKGRETPVSKEGAEILYCFDNVNIDLLTVLQECITVSGDEVEQREKFLPRLQQLMKKYEVMNASPQKLSELLKLGLEGKLKEGETK